ncbi:MAG: MgtC/SapB family protein [Firmicutes bacterium]|nr:MgtC/SapB family protein [Bacillota bacterium]
MTGIDAVSTVFIRLLLSILLGSLIGIERARKRRPAGLRTFALVCIGATMAMLTNIFVVLKYDSGDITRIAAQVISGVGFLGAGTIIVTGKNKVRGLTTAASLWATASLGLAIGAGYYAASFVGFIVIILANTLMHRLDELFMTTNELAANENKILRFHIEISDKKAVYDIFEFLSKNDIVVSKYKLEKKNEELFLFDLKIIPGNKDIIKIKANISCSDALVSIEEIV